MALCGAVDSMCPRGAQPAQRHGATCGPRTSAHHAQLTRRPMRQLYRDIYKLLSAVQSEKPSCAVGGSVCSGHKRRTHASRHSAQAIIVKILTSEFPKVFG